MVHEPKLPITTRGDFEVLSSGSLIGALSFSLILLILVPFGREPLSTDRLANLANMLDDPILAEIPTKGKISLRPDLEADENPFWELSTDYGETYTFFRNGHELTILTSDSDLANVYLRVHGRTQTGLSSALRPYLVIGSASQDE